MPVLRTIPTLALICLATLLPAAEVRMADGRVLEGTILSDESTVQHLALEVTSGRVRAVLRLPRSEIEHIDHNQTQRERTLAAIDERAAELGTGGEAADWWALAQRAQELDPIRFRELAEVVLSRDRHHAGARTALGFVRHNGIWMQAHEARVAQGLLHVDGRWIDWEAWLAREAEREAEAEAREARLAARREARSRSLRRYGVGGRTRVDVQTLYPTGYRRLYRDYFRGGPFHHRSHRSSLVPAASTVGAGGRWVIPGD